MGLFADPYESAVTGLRSAEAGVRRRALLDLYGLGDSRAIPLFLEALKDVDEECRWFAAGYLIERADVLTLRHLEDWIERETLCRYRLWARFVFVGRGFVDMIPAFADDLACVDAETQGVKPWTEATAIAMHLSTLGEPADAAVLALATHANPVVRWIAVLALSQNLTQASSAAIGALESDPDPQVREAAQDVRSGFVRNLYVPLERWLDR